MRPRLAMRLRLAVDARDAAVDRQQPDAAVAGGHCTGREAPQPGDDAIGARVDPRHDPARADGPDGVGLDRDVVVDGAGDEPPAARQRDPCPRRAAAGVDARQRGGHGPRGLPRVVAHALLHPHVGPPGRHVGRRRARRERRRATGVRVDPRQRLLVGVEHPDRTRTGGDDLRGRPDGDAPGQRPGARVEQRELPGTRGRRRRGVARPGHHQCDDAGGHGRGGRRRGDGAPPAPAPGGDAGGHGRRGEARILLEDALLEVAQRGAGLQPELLVEPPPPLGEDLERLRLPPAAIEGEHELAAQALAQRVLLHQRHQRRQVGATERELRVDVVLERGEARLLEVAGGVLRPRLVLEVGERAAAPQRERLGQVRLGSREVCRREGAAARLVQRREPVGVQPRARVDDVAGRPGGDDRVRLERAPQAGHVGLQRHRGVRRRPLAPQRVDQPVGGHHLAGVDQQQCEHRPLAGAAERARPVAVMHLERSEDPEIEPLLHGATLPGGVVVSDLSAPSGRCMPRRGRSRSTFPTRRSPCAASPSPPASPPRRSRFGAPAATAEAPDAPPIPTAAASTARRPATTSRWSGRASSTWRSRTASTAAASSSASPSTSASARSTPTPRPARPSSRAAPRPRTGTSWQASAR